VRGDGTSGAVSLFVSAVAASGMNQGEAAARRAESNGAPRAGVSGR
jgi:hypothetical protein